MGLLAMAEQKAALISVYDKTGLESLARTLIQLKFKILSTGNTARFLKGKGIEVEEISHYTRFPEILEGRVKTLHPKIHAGILARKNRQEDLKTLAELKASAIDLVVVNLYPFETTPTLENIDIGGPTLLRAAAKNYEHVTVVCDPADYDRVAEALAKGETPLDLRKELAAKVFELMARYDQKVAATFCPATFCQLRYGENPHQKAIFHPGPAGELLWQKPLQGKALSYNNILDADAAWWLIREMKKYGCCVIKHTNPCGAALSGLSLKEAFEKALACDSQSAFGSIVAFNQEVDGATAEACAKLFLEIILAPGFSKPAQTILAKKKNLRLLVMNPTDGPAQLVRSAGGGLLLQDVDRAMEPPSQWEIKTKRKPTEKEMEALEFAWCVVKHVKSNAIVFACEDQTLGIGAGQMSRIDAVKAATMKFNACRMTHDARLVVVSSDAFFPFPDNIEAIAKAGATAIIQPGGSIKDAEVIAAADQHNLAMVFAGARHFRH